MHESSPCRTGTSPVVLAGARFIWDEHYPTLWASKQARRGSLTTTGLACFLGEKLGSVNQKPFGPHWQVAHLPVWRGTKFD